MADFIQVEVAFALPERQWLRALRLPAGSTVRQALATSDIHEVLGDLVVDGQNVGIFSRPVSLETVLNDGDRVEVYRPLTRDPKDMRRLRARGFRR